MAFNFGSIDTIGSPAPYVPPTPLTPTTSTGVSTAPLPAAATPTLPGATIPSAPKASAPLIAVPGLSTNQQSAAQDQQAAAVQQASSLQQAMSQQQATSQQTADALANSTSFIPDYSQTPILESVANQAQGYAQPMMDWATQNYNALQGNVNQLYSLANQLNSPYHIASDMGQAEAGVTQATQAALLAAQQSLQSYGIDPSSGRNQELTQAMNVQGAAAAAGAGNQQRVADQQQYQAALGQAVSAQTGAYNAGTQAMAMPNQYLGTAIKLPYSPLGTASTSTSTSQGTSDSSGISQSTGTSQSTGSNLSSGGGSSQGTSTSYNPPSFGSSGSGSSGSSGAGTSGPIANVTPGFKQNTLVNMSARGGPIEVNPAYQEGGDVYGGGGDYSAYYGSAGGGGGGGGYGSGYTDYSGGGYGDGSAPGYENNYGFGQDNSSQQLQPSLQSTYGTDPIAYGLGLASNTASQAGINQSLLSQGMGASAGSAGIDPNMLAAGMAAGQGFQSGGGVDAYGEPDPYGTAGLQAQAEAAAPSWGPRPGSLEDKLYKLGQQIGSGTPGATIGGGHGGGGGGRGGGGGGRGGGGGPAPFRYVPLRPVPLTPTRFFQDGGPADGYYTDSGPNYGPPPGSLEDRLNKLDQQIGSGTPGSKIGGGGGGGGGGGPRPPSGAVVDARNPAHLQSAGPFPWPNWPGPTDPRSAWAAQGIGGSPMAAAGMGPHMQSGGFVPVQVPMLPTHVDPSLIREGLKAAQERGITDPTQAFQFAQQLAQAFTQQQLAQQQQAGQAFVQQAGQQAVTAQRASDDQSVARGAAPTAAAAAAPTYGAPSYGAAAPTPGPFQRVYDPNDPRILRPNPNDPRIRPVPGSVEDVGSGSPIIRRVPTPDQVAATKPKMISNAPVDTSSPSEIRRKMGQTPAGQDWLKAHPPADKPAASWETPLPRPRPSDAPGADALPPDSAPSSSPDSTPPPSDVVPMPQRRPFDAPRGPAPRSPTMEEWRQQNPLEQIPPELQNPDPNLFRGELAPSYNTASYAARGGPIPGGYYQQGGGIVPPGLSPSGGMRTDDVPAVINQTGGMARLNANEFVIPRDVALWKGQEFFQNLIKKSRQTKAGAPARPQMAQARV